MQISFQKVPDPSPGRINMTILPKEVFDYYFFEKHYSRTIFKEKLGISDRIISNSYKYHYTPEERKAFSSQAISHAQKKKNSNAKNLGVPRIKIPKQELVKLLKQGRKIFWIASYYGVSPQVIDNNIEYHKISLEGISYNSFLGYSNVVRLKQVDKSFGSNLLAMHSKGTERDVQAILDTLVNLDAEITEMRLLVRHIRKNAVSYAKANNIDFVNKNLPGSFLNAMFGRAIKECGYPVEYEVKVGDYFYDLLISGTKILIEVDNEHYHSSKEATSNDKLKTRAAKKFGYHLVRVTSDKDKYPTILKKVEKCLRQLKSLKLLQ